MVGMIQVVTYMLGVYLVMKGVEVTAMVACCTRPDRERKKLMVLAGLVLTACIVAACGLVLLQEFQARSIGAAK